VQGGDKRGAGLPSHWIRPWARLSRKRHEAFWILNRYAQGPGGAGGTRHFSLAHHLSQHGWRATIIAASTDHAPACSYQRSCSEVYLEKAFDGTGWRPAERQPVARELDETSLMFLVHPTLTEAELSTTAKVATEVLRAASGS
jgi:dTDP-4-amino-4,6-dideoxygalactose transaminase